MLKFRIVMNEAGSGGAGTGAVDQGTGGATGGGGTPPPGVGNGTSNPWFSGFKADDVRGFIENKGFKDPESLASAYWNLEKTRGVPQERLLTLPGDDKPESWAPVFDKLGRPQKADGYEIKLAEGAPANFLDWQRNTYHELGLTKKQGEALSGKWNELMVAANTADTNSGKEALQQQITSLKQEWGAATGQNADIVDKIVAVSGLNEKQTQAMEKALGFDGFSKFMLGLVQKFGINLGEAKFHGSDTGGNNFNAMTPSAARQKREELLSDPEYRKRWSGGGKAEQKEIDRLYMFEYPTPQA